MTLKQFRYSALSLQGDPVTGELAAEDVLGVMARLHELALLPIDAKEVISPALSRFDLTERPAAPLRGRDLAMVSLQLARLLKAGLALDRALAILVEQTEQRRIVSALQQTLNRVRDGAGLAEALASQGQAFPSTFITLVRAGEMSGALQGVLSETASFLTRAEAMRQKVISSMIYPAILITVASLSIGLILTAVLPQFEPMFREAGAKLPASTRIVIAAGDTLRDDWWLMAVIVMLLVLASRTLLRNPGVVLERDRLLLAAPLLGSLIARFEIGRFCRTLGIMLSSGVGAPSAMTLSGATIGNRVLAHAVEDTAMRFQEGEGLSGPLSRTGRFPSMAIQLIRIGEETGRLDEMLAEVALVLDQEVQRALDRLLAVLVPALTLIMGIMVAFIVASVMLALMSVNALAI